ncbi:hypothetical protein SAMN05216421_0584 [Halopseudomonas xinjiangensis]|uniref:Uncharacterized protein n=1 Tax=Halopseudomonas xinjiangensis TaxID=487184 RepID=A0A1H1N1H3_9GAMM|nr:hypothetical protein [Halopseudomonas xinjiangensis]SDR92836.1 hypothetical protein SAMN05216421_0584 [Halopseudomonas xinjiangensis]
MISEAQFNRGTLDCMTALRRLLKQDTGVVIRLAEPDAIERLLQLSHDSQRADIRELGLRLSNMLEPLAGVEDGGRAQGAIASRRYRVARLPDPATEVPAPASTSVRIYRGQIIRN